MNSKQLLLIIDKFNELINKNKDYLNDLDQTIGDGDHGTNIARGINQIEDKRNDLEGLNPKNILRQSSMILMSKIGGSSGPLLGTLILQIANALPDTDETSLDDWIAGLDKGLDAMEKLGKAHVGDKTMLDALSPAIDALKQNRDNPKKAIAEAAKAAKTGGDSSLTMEAKRGRASYLAERSINHIDPGSVTMSYLFEAVNEVLN